MPGQKVLTLIEEVLFTGPEASEVVRVKCDTGAKRTSIDIQLAERLGCGDPVDEVSVKASNGCENRPVHRVLVRVDGDVYDVEISVTDRSSMTYEAILGRDILSGYLIDPSETSELTLV